MQTTETFQTNWKIISPNSSQLSNLHYEVDKLNAAFIRMELYEFPFAHWL